MSKEFRNKKDSPEKQDDSDFLEKVVHVNRCAKVVKGGRRFTFSALVVVGDGNGQVGLGYGKSKEVPDAIKKASDRARKVMRSIRLKDNTIPHDVKGEFDGGVVILRPATRGTGVIAGGGVRAVLEAAGVKDVLSKSLGSNNDMAMVNATLNALYQLRTADDVNNLRNR